MKTKLALLTLLGMMSSIVFAQSVEYDDMYFNRKDREKLRESMMVSNRTAVSNQRVTTPTSKSEQISRFNPTDSYSARNVNPEFNNQAASQRRNDFADDEYLPEEYANGYRDAQMARANVNNWYAPGFYGLRCSAWHSPYFAMGGIYDPWMAGMWGTPSSMWRMNSGLGFGSSFMWGNSWAMNPYHPMAWDPWYAPRWGNMMGWGWDPFWNPYGGMGMGMAMGGWGNPYWGARPWGTTVVIVGNDYNSHINRTRRPSRGGSFNSQEYYNNNVVRSRDRNVATSSDMIRQQNGRFDNTVQNSRVTRFDDRQGATRSNVNQTGATRSNINTFQSRTSGANSSVTPSSRQRMDSYSPVQQNRSYSSIMNNTRSNNFMSSPSRSSSGSNVGSMGSMGGSRSTGGSVGGSSGGSSGGSRSRGGN